MAHILSHSESKDGCELCVDLTPAYAQNCEKVTRRMTYCHKTKTFETEDEIVSFDENAEKTVHLHYQSEPVIQGNTILFENGGGRAVCEVLSPERVCIEKVGGQGRQFEIGGINYPPVPPYTAEEGWGR